MRRACYLLLACLLSLFAGTGLPAQAQETIERTPNVSGGWVGYPGVVYANMPYRFNTIGVEQTVITGAPTFDVSLGLPTNTLVGARFAQQSPTVPHDPNELEAYARHRPQVQADGAPFDLAVTTAFNVPAQSIDGEISVARWIGPVRLIGATRAMSSLHGRDDPGVVAAGGAVLHVLPGRLPLAIAGDVAVPIEGGPNDDRLAWSAGLQTGVSFTDLTFSIFATNTATSTLQGASRGTEELHIGFEVTIPVPVGRFAGWYAPREQALEAVVENPAEVNVVLQADIRNYLFLPKKIEIEAGTTVEWVNHDAAIHTVNAEDGAWASGPIEEGERWRARFDEPGRYLYYCGPHPFMKGVVVVR